MKGRMVDKALIYFSHHPKQTHKISENLSYHCYRRPIQCNNANDTEPAD
jgi:hypothetical protein